MQNYKNVILMDSVKIIDIVRRTLSKIDPRLVDHGERVGYIAKKIYDVLEDKSDFYFSKMFVLCLLHDIGAYKTDEIDDMVKFETEKSLEHSLYGYLFLRNTKHLAEYAEALLYHHTDYLHVEKKNTPYAKYAEIIYIADRVDILLNSPSPDLSLIRDMAGSKFNPDYAEALFKAEKKYEISKKITSGEYRDEAYALLKSLDIDSNEIMEYLKLIVYAIDFRSPFTVIHTADTTAISVEIGKLLGLDEHELQMLCLGAFLHDIGKIAVPPTILEKPGRLTVQECAIMKGHIEEGEAILRGVVNDEICDIALRHHEKLDGSGYPLGIGAEEITVSQRIVAVADIVSALSQKRSYKEPFPKEKVISILTEMSDSGLLCPKVVNAICQNYDMILKTAEENHHPVKAIYDDFKTGYARCYKELGYKLSDMRNFI